MIRASVALGIIELCYTRLAPLDVGIHRAVNAAPAAMTVAWILRVARYDRGGAG
jgi:hypothetical protein